MNYEIVQLPQTFVGGLAVRTNNSIEQSAEAAQLPKTWARAARREYQGGMTAAAYIDYEDDKDGFYTEVIGQTVTAINDLQLGDVLTYVPAGTYAKFHVEGKLPQAVITAWSAIWQAEKEKTLHRAYTTDLELYPKDGVVEVYVAIRDE